MTMEEKGKEQTGKLSYEELNEAASNLHAQYQKLMAEYQKAINELNRLQFDGVAFELSMLFNILAVDITRPVTIVEGPMDSFLIRNCVALCGAGKHIEFPFEVRYMFDDDKAGREHAIEKIREGYDVFLWDNFKKDIGMQSHGKVDFNDVVMWCDKNNVRIPSLDGYYSNDELDLIMI